MRTITSRELVSVGQPSFDRRFTPKRIRVARMPRNEVGPSGSGACVAPMLIGACSTATNPFAELETLHITIWETEAATGAVVSICAIPSLAMRNAVS